IWRQHVVLERDDGAALLYVDRHLLHDGSHNAFKMLRESGRVVKEPAQAFAFADHYLPTSGRAQGLTGIADPVLREMVERLESNARAAGVLAFGAGDPRQGIVHVVAPELGLTEPGLLIVCGDSHTSTHGALGALAFGIGASEVAHVLATQTLWQIRPKTMR